MVKRIKKRIPRADGGEDIVEVEEGEGTAAPESATETLEHLRDKIGEVAPDEFVDWGARVLEWFVKHRLKLIGVVVLAVCTATAAHYIMKWRRTSLESKAAIFFDAGKALDEARAELPAFTLGEEKPKQPLSADERKARLEKARDAFTTARTEAGERPLGRISTLGLAGAQFQLGKLDEALKLYDEVAADPALDPVARATALQGRATTLEALAKPAEAIEAWRKLEAMDAKSYALLTALEVGRILEAQGKAAEAKTLYEKAQQDQSIALGQLGNADVKREIEKRLARLGDGT